MPEVASVAIDNRAKHVFKISPKMSTYLVAWVIGDLKSFKTTVQTAEGIKSFKIWGTPQRCKIIKCFYLSRHFYVLPGIICAIEDRESCILRKSSLVLLFDRPDLSVAD